MKRRTFLKSVAGAAATAGVWGRHLMYPPKAHATVLNDITAGNWGLLSGSIYPTLWRDGSNHTVDDTYGMTGTSAAKENSVQTYCGLVIDERRGLAVALAVGGHSSTLDNSSMGFNLSDRHTYAGDAAWKVTPGAAGTTTPWGRFDDPSPPAILAEFLPDPPGNQFLSWMSDGRPQSTHNYGSTIHMLGPRGEVDKYVMTGGNIPGGAGNSFHGIGIFDPVTKTWEQKQPSFVGGNGIACCWDSIAQRLLMKIGASGVLYEYYPLTDTLNLIINDIGFTFLGEIDWNASMAFDTRRYRLYIAAASSLIYIQFNLDSGAPVVNPSTGLYHTVVAFNDAVLPYLGTYELNGGRQFHRSKGILFDTVRDRVVLYNGQPTNGTGGDNSYGGDSSNTLFAINPDTEAVTVITTTGAPADSCGNHGVFTRFRYYVSEDVYIHCKSSASGILAYRPEAVAGRKSFAIGALQTWRRWVSTTGIQFRDSVLPQTSEQASKHTRLDVLNGRIVALGGDRTWTYPNTASYGGGSGREGNGSNWVGDIDPSECTPGATTESVCAWRTLDPITRPGSVKKLGWPDNTLVAADNVRNKYYAMRGFWFSTQGAQAGTITQDMTPTSPGPGDTLTISANTNTLAGAMQIGSEWIMFDNRVNGVSVRVRVRGAKGTTAASHTSGDSYNTFACAANVVAPGNDGPGDILQAGTFDPDTLGADGFGTWVDSPWAANWDGTHGTDSAAGRVHIGTDSIWSMKDGIVWRIDIGTGNVIGYWTGDFDHGNGETSLSSQQLHNQQIDCDQVGWKLYQVAAGVGKLFQFDIRKALAYSDTSGVPANGSNFHAPNSGADWCKLYTIPVFPLPSATVPGLDQDRSWCQFDQLNRIVFTGCISGHGGEAISFYAFNPLDGTFFDLGVTSAEFPGTSGAGEYLCGLEAVYVDACNVLAIIGGNGAGVGTEGDELYRHPGITPSIPIYYGMIRFAQGPSTPAPAAPPVNTSTSTLSGKGSITGKGVIQ